MRRYGREWRVLLALGVVLVLMAVAAPAFYEPAPLLSRLAAQMPALVAAVGMTLVMVSRQIDISIGSQFGLCAVLAGSLAAMGWSMAMALFGAVLGGALLGALNGVLVAGLGLPSIVVTLATMVTWQEGLRLWQQGRFVNLPGGMQWFGLGQTAGQCALLASAIGVAAVVAWGMRHVAVGRHVYAVGSDAEAARLAGLHPRTTTFGVFVVMGALTGLGAAMSVVQSPQVDPNGGIGLELKAIAAAVVGGVAVSGGRGRVWGAVAGLLLLGTVNPALTYLRVEAYWEKAIQGWVILLAVVADGWSGRAQGKGRGAP